MNTLKEKHLGSGFDDFLGEEGLLAEAQAVAATSICRCQILRPAALRRRSCVAPTSLSSSSVSENGKWDWAG